MCGIVGVISDNRSNGLINSITEACRKLHHRGPDDSGVWHDESAGAILGHVRLSVLDLSPAGHQPMLSSCGRFVIVFNGEIYNHLNLRRRLESAGVISSWRGHSDTETMLACVAEWGIEKTLKSTVGMFAFALWDRQDNCLTLARDRLGEKPLYYGFVGYAFAFASELKALKVIPGFSSEVDHGALSLMMRHNHVPGPYCIYRGLLKLQPGMWLQISNTRIREKTLPEPEAYWSARGVAEHGVKNPFTFSSDQLATDALEALLTSAIAEQMLADVPLGAFLSGGVDSSTVVALMQKQSSQPVKTFTIGFDETGYDEAKYAELVAKHLGTDHTELYVRPEDALAVIPDLPSFYDEPFADSSQIPTYLIAKFARQHVTVALSGDGGDELFGGYNRYILAARKWKQISALPLGLRRKVATGINAVTPESWDRLYRILEPLCPTRYKINSPGLKLQKTAKALSSQSEMELYKNLITHLEPQNILLCGEEPDTVLNSLPNLPNLIEKMMYFDSVSYLPDDILVKVDRAAMATSLETRVPLLNHRIYEFAWRLPFAYKVRNGVGKWVLRQVLYRHVPRSLIERPKAGFGLPLDIWLRGSLRAWAENLLDKRRLKEEGFFHPELIRRYWNEHLSGTRNWQQQLWCVLMFQSWLDHNKSGQD